MSENPDTNDTAGAALGTDIVTLVEHNPVIVLVDAAKRDLLLAHIEKEVAEFKADVSTAKGREECRSFAAKIVRTKTTVDKSRLALTEEARQKIKSVNAEGAIIEDRLKALAVTARAPLTEWEDREEKRETECKAALERLRGAAIVSMGIASDSIRSRIAEVEAESMAEDKWGGMTELAATARDAALSALNSALALVEQKERDDAELARLREEAAASAAREQREREDRERAEQEAREAQETNDREVREKQERDSEREQQEREAAAEKERLSIGQKQAATAAAEAAQREAEARAAEQAAEQKRQHDEALAAERRRAEDAERQALAEREAREAEKRQQEQAAAAQAAERARLEADQARRRTVKADAKDAIMTCGANEETAQKIVLAIMAGEVPRVFLDFAADPPKAEPADPGVGRGAGIVGDDHGEPERLPL